MHRNDLIFLLETHLTKTSEDRNSLADLESKMILQTLDFVKSYPNCFSSKNLPGHITGSAFIFDKKASAVLFTHHKKLKKWLQLGGHSDGNSNIFETVLREAQEESGIKSFTYYEQEIFDVDIHPIPENKKMPAHLHFDIRFLLFPQEKTLLKISNESLDLKWIKIEEVKNYTSEISILRMLRKLNFLNENGNLDI